MVQCKECDRQLNILTNSHLRSHNLTPEQYLVKYPDSSLMDTVMEEKIVQTRHRVPIEELPKCAYEQCFNKVKSKGRKFCSQFCSNNANLRKYSPFCKREGCGQRLTKNYLLYCSRDCFEMNENPELYEFKKNPPKCKLEECSNIITKKGRQFCSYSCSSKDKIKHYQEWTGIPSVGWKGGYYTREQEAKVAVRLRDENKCRWCKKDVTLGDAQVHHIIPKRCFQNPDEANTLDNMILLCRKCHMKFEWTTIRELYRRALQLDSEHSEDENHITFAQFKEMLINNQVPSCDDDETET